MAASMPTVASEKNISNSSLPTPIQTQQTQSASDSAVMSQSADADDFETYVANRTEELRQLAMTDDPNSLATILSELDNREPRIRKAALDAAVQFGSRDAIPSLQEAIRHTDDPQEKVNLQNAIDFLKLPTMGEITTR